MSREQFVYWLKKYGNEEVRYNTGLEQELGGRFRRTKTVTKGDLSRIVEWKFQGRLLGRRNRILKLMSRVPDDFVRKVSKESFNEHDERLRASKLMGRYGGIKGVGPAIASVILAFYDPKNYGVFDIHAWRELMGKQPEDLFTLENLIRFLTRLREEATRLDSDARHVEKAYFKKNLDENQNLARPVRNLKVSVCPQCGSSLVWRVAGTGERYRDCTNFRGGCRWNDRSY